MDASLQQEFNTAIAAIEKIRAALEAREEMPSAVLDVSEEPTCQVCSCVPTWREIDKERGICGTCAEHMDEGLKYYTEDFAYASLYGKDATHLFILRQRADNCRDTIADAAGSYDGYLDLHEASLEEKILNKRAAECLARLPASFAPWWRDAWTHEKWCQVYDERKAAGWPLASADVPIVQRLAAAAVAKEDKMHEMKKAHAEVLGNIERARKEDMEAVEARHKREMTKAVAEAVKEQVEAARTERAMGAAVAEARHKREMAEKDKQYREALAPLISVRDKMRAECEKKVEEADRKAHAMGYAFADQKWNPVYKAVCEELELVRKEGANHEAGYIRLLKERDELILGQVDLRQELAEQKALWDATPAQSRRYYETGYAAGYSAAEEKFSNTSRADATEIFQAMRSDLERLGAENKALERRVAEESKWCKHANMTTSTAEMHAQMLRTDLATLQKKYDALLELVEPTKKLIISNPELFGGEALPRTVAPGEALPQTVAPGEARSSSSPRPPAIIRLPPIKEEDNERALKFLKALLAPSRSCLLVESPPTVLPGLQEAVPCSSQTEGMCMALTEAQYEEMFGADRPSPLPPIVPDEPKVCGAGGCIDCPVAAEPVAGAQPEPVAGAQKPIPVCCVDCGKPKPDYNHPNWPSPITKRFAKHLAKHSGLRSPWHSHDPKAIKTHEDALEYIAKRVNISVENLLGWTMKQYQTTYDPWTLVKGPNYFHTGTAPATWWC